MLAPQHKTSRLAHQPDQTRLVYLTYLGGSGNDVGFGIAVDTAGNAYVTGYTSSSDFPTTAGALDTTFNGGYDVFVAKLNAAGSGLVSSTYLGGSGDYGYGIAVDAAGNAYVTGYTGPSDFPTTAGALDTTFNGGYYDAFVAKLNAAGSGLVYLTYLGGSGNDVGFGIAVDAAGNAYVTGQTSSSDFPTTAGALDRTLSGSEIRIHYDGIEGLSVDAQGVLHVQTALGELTDDAPFIYQQIGGRQVAVAGQFKLLDADAYTFTVTGSYDPARELVIDPDLAWSTYLGGGGNDYGYGIAVDAAGNAYVTGYTSSSDFPTTAGALGTTFNGGYYDAFVAKLNAAGSGLVYLTYLGGGGNDYGYGIAVDAAGNAYVTGGTCSNDFPTTAGALDRTYNGGSYDAFVAKLTASGSGLVGSDPADARDARFCAVVLTQTVRRLACSESAIGEKGVLPSKRGEVVTKRLVTERTPQCRMLPDCC